MKRMFILALAVAALCGCQHDLNDELDFNVTLAPENVYVAGEPVVFDFEGNVDNIVFYSGEKGAEYRYSDRYSIPVESIESATLSMSIISKYGKNGALECWITDKYDGLWGDDSAADRELLRSLAESGMEDWKQIDYTDPVSGGTIDISLDIMDMKDNFCIAFHWNPIYDGKNSQRTYQVNGEVELNVKDVGVSKMDFGGLDFTAVMMNEERDAYIATGSNGEIILNDKVYDLFFKGCGATEFDYALDGWAVSRPRPLNKVMNDKGRSIKNTQNYLHSYEYTWESPGTYTVTFVGSNSNYKGASQIVREMKVIIVEKFQVDQL